MREEVQETMGMLASAEIWGRALTMEATREDPRHPVLFACRVSLHHRYPGKFQDFSSPLFNYHSGPVILESREREGGVRGRMRMKKKMINEMDNVQAHQ